MQSDNKDSFLLLYTNTLIKAEPATKVEINFYLFNYFSEMKWVYNKNNSDIFW